jgi:hypothetical protein
VSIARLPACSRVGCTVALWLCFCSGGGAVGESEDYLIREKLAQLSMQTATSASGRFVVSCRDLRLHMPVMAWAERVYADVQAELGGALSFEQRQLVIRIHASGSEPSVELLHFPEKFRQRLELPAPLLGTEEGEAWLVQALLGAWRTHEGVWMSGFLPRWLWVGVAGQLSPQQRARAMDRALTRWERGALVSPVQVLGTRGVEMVDDSVASVALMRWFGMRNRKGRYTALMERLATGGGEAGAAYVEEELSEGVASMFLENWDRWMERERDVIHTAGMVSVRMLRRLEAELLLSEGVCGIPKGVFNGASVTFAALPRWASAPWFGPFAREKQVRLEVLVGGHGQSLVDVGRSYAQYVQALLEGRLGEAVGLLVEADGRAADLSARLEAAGGMLFEVVGSDETVR